MKLSFTLITILILALAASAQVDKKYDRFKDETNVSIVLGKTGMDANYNSLTLSLGATFAGQTVPAEPTITMTITVTSNEWKLLNRDITLRAIIDGERVTVAEFKRIHAEVYHGATMEVAVAPVTISNLKKVANGKSVEIQFMGNESVGDSAEQAKIRSFIDALKP